MCVVPVKLAIDLVDVALNSDCKHSEVVEVVVQGLCGGNRVDGCIQWLLWEKLTLQ